MPKNAGDKLRLIHLVKIFEKYSDGEHTLSVSDLQKKLEERGISATRQTIYADIYDLQSLGYGVICQRGAMNRYYLSEREFNLAELKLMVDAVQSAKFIPGGDASRLIDKISSLTSVYRAGKLKRQIYLLDRAAVADRAIFDRIDDIHEAIADKALIKFRYFDRNEKKELIARHNGEFYTVSPVTLIWDDENYYLVAFDEKEGVIKHFRVDKIGDLSITDKKAPLHPEIEKLDLSSYSKQVFGMYGGRRELVTLECVNSLSGVMIDRFGKDVTFFRKDDRRFTLTVGVNISPNFYSWIAAFGDKIKITAPESVLDEFCKMLENILKGYCKE